MFIKHIPVKLRGPSKSAHPITSLNVFVESAKTSKTSEIQDRVLEVRIEFKNFVTPKLTILDRLFGRYREFGGISVDRKTQCVASIELSTHVLGCFLSIMREVDRVSALISHSPQIDAHNANEVNQVLIKYREAIASACAEYARVHL